MALRQHNTQHLLLQGRARIQPEAERTLAFAHEKKGAWANKTLKGRPVYRTPVYRPGGLILLRGRETCHA